MIPARVLDALVAAGATAEMIAAAVKADQAIAAEKEAARRAKAAERKRHSRSRDVTRTERDSVGQSVTERDPPPSSSPLTLPLITTPTSSLRSESFLARAREDWPVDAFDRFWASYPHRVGRRAALRAFAAAKRSGVPFARLLAALERYIAEKPPDRAWCNPATWLNQGRWDDEPAATGPPASRQAQPSFHDIAAELRSKANGSNQQCPDQGERPLDGEIELPGLRSRA